MKFSVKAILTSGTNVRAAGTTSSDVRNTQVPQTWGERIRALRYVTGLFSMVWGTSRALLLGTTSLRICAALFPLAILWVSKLILDGVVWAKRHPGGGLSAIWELLALELLLAVGANVLGRVVTLLDSLLADKFTHCVTLKLMSHAASLDLASFEDAVFYDKLERARRQTTTQVGLIAKLLGMAQQLLTLCSLLFAVVAFHPFLLFLLVAATIPVFIGETRLAQLNYSFLYRNTPERRQLDYLRLLGTSLDSAKEIKIFDLCDHLIGNSKVLFERFYDENKLLSRRRMLWGACLSLVPTLAYYLAYASIIVATVRGTLSIGALAMLAGAFSRSRSIINTLVSGLASTAEQSYFLKDLFDFLAMKPIIVSPINGVLAPRPIRKGFQFQNVSFKYPGSDYEVLTDVSFALHPGERIALVGENGAGKTTIVKLIARLYEPTNGRVLLDGIDLREYDLEDIRREIGVIFQDYVRYDMSVKENIGFGRVVQMWKDNRIQSSAEMSNAANVIETFPNKYEQMLGKRFEGGIDLSGGEWQRIALARAYMRDAQVIILDEPTASLDARAEVEMYHRFVELTTARMAILISHRFSTLRIADRALVLERGTIVEQGSHHQLLARKGKYAELFELQAAGYR
jgi:ATP-binding cassette, subfamily B, bacterial